MAGTSLVRLLRCCQNPRGADSFFLDRSRGTIIIEAFLKQAVQASPTAASQDNPVIRGSWLFYFRPRQARRLVLVRDRDRA